MSAFLLGALLGSSGGGANASDTVAATTTAASSSDEEHPVVRFNDLETQTLLKADFSSFDFFREIHTLMNECLALNYRANWTFPTIRCIANILTIEGRLVPMNRSYINKDRDVCRKYFSKHQRPLFST